MQARTRIVLGVAILVGAQVAAWLVYRSVEREREPTGNADTFAFEALSGEAPGRDLPLELPSGAPVRLNDYENEPVVLHFWATWCAPCRRELPALLEQAAQTSGERPARLVLVSVDQNWETVRHYFDGDVPASVVLDAAGTLKDAYGVTTLPETYLVRRGAVLSARLRGAQDWSSSAARSALNELGAAR